MKKKTTWAASVVKKQLQTCCKHQTFSLETGDDCNTSQGSTQRVINISSPIRELFHHQQQQEDTSTSTTPVLQRRKSFSVLHGRSLLSSGTPEPLTPFRKSVESAIPLCRSSSAGTTTFINKSSTAGSSQQRLKEESEPVAVVPKVVPSCPPLQPTRKVVLHKSGPLPVLQQLLRNGGGVVGSSPLHVKKQLSGPLPGGRPPVAPGSSGAPSPLLPPRISKVKFSPTTTNILLTVKDRTSPPQCGFQPSSPEFAKIETVADLRDEEEEVEASREEPEARNTEQKQAHAAATKIQAAYRGHRARAALASRERGTSDDEDDDDGEVSVPSISTQMSRTDPQKQRKSSPAPQQQQQQQRGGLVPLRDNKGWNGSIRSAQDHQTLLRSRQEAAMKRERAMEYALSRQRWRSGKPASSLKPWMITPDDRVPDKPGWVRNWLERATRMDNNANPELPKVEDPPPPPESESLSMKSTVGMCTTDIGSLPPLDNNNLGWPLSLRQQHAAGLLHHAAATPPPHKFPCEFSTSTASGESGARPGDQSRTTPHLHYHRRSNDDRESVGSCDGPPMILIKVPSPAASKPRIQKHSGGNSNSLKDNKVPSREKMLHQEHPQSQVSVALSDGNSDDTTAASIQRPLWR